MEKRTDSPPQLGHSPGAAVVTTFIISLLIFLLLPLTQWLSIQNEKKVIEISDIYMPPPPAPPPEPPPPEEDKDKEEDLKMKEDRKPPTLEQLELSLNPELSGGGAGDFTIPSFDINEDTLGELIFEVGDLDEIPKPFYTKKAVHPPDLKRSRIGGTVVLDFIVDENGRVLRPKVIRSDHSGFDRAAIDAIRAWRFRPGKKDGKKVKTHVQMPYVFKINK